MSPLEDHKTESSVAAALCDRMKEYRQLTSIDAKSILVFSDKTIAPLERFADNPRRKRASVTVDDQASFADYVNQHKVAFVTALFGRINKAGGAFSGILDFHTQNVPESTPGTTPNWGEHRVGLTLGFTPEWERWTKNDGASLSQLDFAEFIEDNLSDIHSPPAADLLEVIQDLTAKKEVNFKSTIRLDNGQVGLLYDEQISSGKRDGQIDVPRDFTISIAPFLGSPAVGIKARLRFRINDGHLQFVYKLNQPHKVLEAAFDSARTYIAHATGIPVLLGVAQVNAAPAA